MARPAKETIPLPDGRQIAVCLKCRGEVWRVQFPDPTKTGKYKEVTTGRRTEREAWPEAGRIVLAAYSETGLRPTARTVTWEQVLDELPQAVTLRPRTLEMYDEAVRSLRRYVPECKGPGDITPERARRFRHLFSTGTYTRGKGEGAKQYTRSAATVKNAVHRLSCLWSHLKEMGLAEVNVWDGIPRPTLPKKSPSAPSEGDFAAFFGWVDAKGWELMSVFLRVKALAGCRTADLCSVRAGQFDRAARSLTITHEQDKTHRTRVIPLPADLSARLSAIVGKHYLWERYTDFARATGDPRVADTFEPNHLRWAVRRLFVNYANTFPDRRKMLPHDLRRRAITLTVKATGSVDATAAALGVNAATARRHYLDAQQAFDSAELMEKMAAVLLPTG